MYPILATTLDSIGNLTRQVTAYKLSVFPEIEPLHGGLSVLFNLWTVLRRDADMPDAPEFSSHRLAIMAPGLKVTLIDVSDPNPWRFKIITEHGLVGTRDNKLVPGQYLVDIACNLRSRALMRDCMNVRETRRPSYQEVSTKIQGVQRRFMQLTLPLKIDETTTTIVIGTRKI
ncbi:MAG: hypothetical protein JKY20_08665 [Alphaproteobacteria bacterium]|nr:hypothetical protein [Alphaproteobacteria bacterium]